MNKYILWDVDTQYDFIKPEGKLYVSGAEKIEPNLEKLINAARDSKISILGSVDYHHITDEELADDADYINTFPPHCIKDTSGQSKVYDTIPVNPLWINSEPYPANELFAMIHQHKGEIYFRKQKFDVFTNPNVLPVLDVIKPHRVILFGVALDVCNAYAIEGFLKLQIPHIYLISDAVKAIDEKKGEQLIKSWVNKGVVVKTTKEIISEFSK